MSFLFKCPNCNNQLEAQDEWIGQSAQCPLCKKSIVIQRKAAIEPKPLIKSQSPVAEKSIPKQISEQETKKNSGELKFKERISWPLFIFRLAALCFFGWIYVWLLEIPIVSYIFPLLYGVVAGSLGVTVGKKWALVLFAFLAVYFQWVWTINHLADELILNPVDLWVSIVQLSEVRKITVNKFLLPQVILCLGWIAESLIIFCSAIGVGMPSSEESADPKKSNDQTVD